MWLIDSSIGRKVVMSVTGLALILFLTFHACMNVVALFSAEGYNMICEFLGANWYAVVATVGLAALMVLHFVFAIILTLQNKRARGTDNYEVSTKTNSDGLLDMGERWASSSMLLLGCIICLGLILHLYNFWYNMMWSELMGNAYTQLPSPSDGYAWIEQTFSQPVFVVLYIIWLCAIWLHINHGFWSAIQTLGWSGKIWHNRWQCIGFIWSTVVILMFLVVVIKFAIF
ncbi:MAG: succinate dehydrogenase/fumarate reductase cytochrome b subunit [Bacteroidaceae bacterium]|nr:succinate dehydrogenase/fumarate reductase cytochrome b subunit [Bacteroidaceae bacterium]